MIEMRKKEFTNGIVYALKTKDGYLVETTDTFLPLYTKDCINGHSNSLKNDYIGDRSERWMIGVSVQSGCPVHCKFCATGQLKKWRNLSAEEIIQQVEFIISQNKQDPNQSKEFKINYTRMGEYSLNKDEIKTAIEIINKKYPNVHHFISTVGVKNDDFSWVKDNITLQISVHSLNEEYRDWLIPIKNKMTLKELGQIRTQSNLKTTLNLTLTNQEKLDVKKLREYFDPQYFFIKLSPLNENCISKENHMETVIDVKNVI